MNDRFLIQGNVEPLSELNLGIARGCRVINTERLFRAG